MKRELAIFLSAGAMLCAEVATARDAAFERAPYMDASLSIDARPKYFSDAVRESVAWIEKTAGCVPCKAPAAAFDPLYSSWYSFHRDVHAANLEAELAVAAKLGMKTFIVDDGWQYEEGAPVGYPHCGDWRLAKGRFPDMASSGTE